VIADDRPDPDALLARVQREEKKRRRGRLKIFFGASAGVGKTYGMLLAARDDEPSASQLLQMLGGIGDRGANALRQQLDAALALGELLEQLQSMGMGDSLGHGRELGEQNLLGAFA